MSSTRVITQPGPSRDKRTSAGPATPVMNTVTNWEDVPLFGSEAEEAGFWGENRIEAIVRMRRALREYQIRGIKTNIPFHQWILRHSRFMAGDYDTRFIEDEYRFMQQEEVYPHKDIALASAAIAALHREQERTMQLIKKGTERTRWRDEAQRASLRQVSSFPTRGWNR